MRKKLLILSTAVLSLALFGCPPKPEGGASGAAASTGGEILVGEYGSLTGPQATFGQSTHNGILLAVDEVNSGGGVNGRQIKVLTEDDQSKQEEAANAVTKLISQNSVVAVLGEVASSASIAAAPICQSNKVPMITPSSTNAEVTKKGDYIFRMCFIDDYQGEQLAVFAAQRLNVKRAAVLVDVKSDYSTGLAKVFEAKFQQLGGQIVARASYANGDSDFKSQLTSVKSANPQILFVPGYYTDIGQIAIQARDLGMTQPLVGGDGWESPKLIEIGGKALEGCFYSNHYFAGDPDPRVRDFVQKYKDRFGQTPDALAALGYDSAKVLADSLKRAGKTDGSSIRDAISQTKNFPGVTGDITVGPDRNPAGKKLVIVEIKNGQLALRDTILPGGASAPAAAAPAAGAPAATDTTKTDTTVTSGRTQ
ncbi:MAG TPA: ABC transporter substrate-binding protein [Thermoanaerobaculia bacterium]|nr:ABC transporter substrate-binding protein [Thermoanaerobaculia bacterium]